MNRLLKEQLVYPINKRPTTSQMSNQSRSKKGSDAAKSVHSKSRASMNKMYGSFASSCNSDSGSQGPPGNIAKTNSVANINVQ